MGGPPLRTGEEEPRAPDKRPEVPPTPSPPLPTWSLGPKSILGNQGACFSFILCPTGARLSSWVPSALEGASQVPGGCRPAQGALGAPGQDALLAGMV